MAVLRIIGPNGRLLRDEVSDFPTRYTSYRAVEDPRVLVGAVIVCHVSKDKHLMIRGLFRRPNSVIKHSERICGSQS